MALPYLTTTCDYRPNQGATMELLQEVRAACQELWAGKRSAEGSNSAVTTATIHATPAVKSRTVYDDSDKEDC